MISEASNKQQQIAKTVLNLFFRSIKFLGRQGLPLTRICSTCFFHGLTQRWRGVLHQNFESLYLKYRKRYQGAVFKN